jgi:hypothetical protein
MVISFVVNRPFGNFILNLKTLPGVTASEAGLFVIGKRET